jgi:hypothetical protein
MAWNLAPTLVAVRGKIVSSGSNVQCNCSYMTDKSVNTLPSVSSATVYWLLNMSVWTQIAEGSIPTQSNEMATSCNA